MALNFAQIDTRPSVTTFAMRYPQEDECPACGDSFDLDDEACYVDDEIHHFACVELEFQRRNQ